MSPRKRPSLQPSSLTDALKYCALILKDQGTISETHCRIDNRWITAFNGTLAIGHKTDSDLTACPQIKLTSEALSKCGQNIAIANLDNNRLAIKSDSRFKAIIPCVSADLLPAPIPDPPMADIDNRLKDAFEVCGLLQTDNAQSIIGASILLNGQSMISSLSGQMLIEYWHGLNLPTGLAIPKALIAPLSKINKKLTKFGFSQWSVTLYFEDDSWIRSQLYAEPWPDLGTVFECQHNLQQPPVDFFAAVKAVAPFGEGLVYCRDERLSSHATDAAGASYDIPGMVGSGPWCYPARQLVALQPWMTHCDFQALGAHGPMLYAVGKSARAIVAGVRQ